MRTPQQVEREAATLRLRTLGLAVVPLVLIVPALLAPADAVVAAFVMPASLAGLVLPVIAYRTYHYLLDRTPAASDAALRFRRLRSATMVSIAVSASASLLGTVAFWLSGSPIALVGSAMHVIVTGAVWPSPPRLRRFVEEGSGRS